MAQLKLLQGYEGDLKTPSNPINEQEEINPAFSEGQLLFTIQDARLNDEITSINANYGGYIYLDYLFNSNKYRLPMISPYSDKALYDFKSGIALSNSVKDNSIIMDTINHTTLLWKNFDGDSYAIACNYYPTNFTWNANTGAVNLSYYLQKGASNDMPIYDTITLDSIPIATETTAGILTGEVAADEQRSNIQFIGGIKKFTNLVQITQGDAASATANTGALQVTGGIRATAGSYFASTVGIDGALNVNNTGTFSGNVFVGTESAANPYYKLTDSNKNAWYFQALNNKCYIGPTSAKALNIDTSGNIQAVGSISIGRKANTTMGQVSVAIGGDITASGDYSHAEGYYTTTSGMCSHAEGMVSIASGQSSHAEGQNTTASGSASHAEGNGTIASGNYSHVEGQTAKAAGTNSHAEGCLTIASGEDSHAEGLSVNALGDFSHAEGKGTITYGQSSHAEGYGKVISVTITGNANATTYTLASANSDIKIGQIIKYNNIYTEILSYDSSTSSIIVNTTLSTTALNSVIATIYTLVASGNRSHAEGYNTVAFGHNSHAEGYSTNASGQNSHSEGYNTNADGNYSHAEGLSTTASGSASHAEGNSTIASGSHSHVEGYHTIASGSNSHAEGYYTTANSKSQHVQGEYNVLDTANATARSTYAHIVGNGTGSSARSNAHTLDWSGNAWFAGDVYVRSTSGTNKDSGSKKLATESFVTNSYLPLTGGTINGNLTVNGNITGTKVYGAVWNDYAEYRQTHHKVRAGQCVYEKGDGSLAISYERMMPGANIVSDTFGFAIGETKKCKTPLAVSGRVLAYPYEPKEEYKAGDAVCSGPNGTISKMTRAEIRDYPERIIGTVSEIPTYEVWGSGNVKVNGRIWIKVR